MREIRSIKPNILVATPGRLIDMLNSGNLHLDEVKFQILDEGDKMLDMGFEEDIVEIQKHLTEGYKSMIFSATVPGFIQQLALKKMKNPILIDLVGNDTNQVPERITNKAVICANHTNKMKHVQTFIENNKDKKILIFTETKTEAKAFERMTYANFLTLHGDLEQAQREIRLKKYKEKGAHSILVATDVCARGLDIDDIDVVI